MKRAALVLLFVAGCCSDSKPKPPPDPAVKAALEKYWSLFDGLYDERNYELLGNALEKGEIERAKAARNAMIGRLASELSAKSPAELEPISPDFWPSDADSKQHFAFIGKAVIFTLFELESLPAYASADRYAVLNEMKGQVRDRNDVDGWARWGVVIASDRPFCRALLEEARIDNAERPLKEQNDDYVALKGGIPERELTADQQSKVDFARLYGLARDGKWDEELAKRLRPGSWAANMELMRAAVESRKEGEDVVRLVAELVESGIPLGELAWGYADAEFNSRTGEMAFYVAHRHCKFPEASAVVELAARVAKVPGAREPFLNYLNDWMRRDPASPVWLALAQAMRIVSQAPPILVRSHTIDLAYTKFYRFNETMCMLFRAWEVKSGSSRSWREKLPPKPGHLGTAVQEAEGWIRRDRPSEKFESRVQPLIDAKKFEKAVAVCREALDIKPGDADALIMLRRVIEAQKRP